MTEVVNTDVNLRDVASPADESISPAHEMANVPENQSQNHLGQDDDKAMNFKAIRESNARLQKQFEDEQREKQEYRERLEKLEKVLQEQSRPPTQEEIDELADLGKDDWTTREAVEKLAERQAKAMYQRLKEEDERKRLEDERKRQIQELPSRLSKEHPDFDSVVTKENVEYLKANRPHIAQSLAATQDPYAQALAAYDAIKAFCPNAQVQAEKERMEKNANRPGTLGAAQGASPLSQAASFEKGLTPELKKQLQNEMIASMRGG